MGRGGQRSTRRAAAQATLEFAMVAPLFFLVLLAAIDAGLWAVQTTAAVAAVEQAARDAASAPAGPLQDVAPDARTVAGDITRRLAQSLFATRLVPWCGAGTEVTTACAPAACPASPADVQARFGPRVVAVCVQQSAPPPCTPPPAGEVAPYPPYCDDSPMVTVRLIGYVAALVPPGFGVGTQSGELPTDIAATTHTLRFAP